MQKNRNGDIVVGVGGLVIVALLILAIIGGIMSITIVPAGERGVRLTFGRPSEIVLEEGLHFKVPFAQRIVKMEVRTQKYETQAAAASRDLQTVRTDLAINFRLISDQVPVLYQELGLGYRERIIAPAVQEIIKSVTAKFTAEELITRRPEVRIHIEEELIERLSGRYIQIEAVSIVDFQFSSSFEDAIEQKVTAEQLKLKAERDLERIQIEAKQTEEKAIGNMNAEIARAEGQARAISIIQKQLSSSPDYLDYYKIDKWDGVLPKVVGSDNFAMINLE
jgi:regulator of protease activity HflC (stomatin/prohibitin superfamily)